MQGPPRAALFRCFFAGLCALSLLPVAGCKEQGSSGQDLRPLPTPEPPASQTPAAPREETSAPPKKRSPDETKPKSAEAVPTPPAPVASAADSAAAPSVAPSAAPLLTAPNAACLARCQGALQGCLSAPVDGGVPGFGNLDLCKKALEACQAACQP